MSNGPDEFIASIYGTGMNYQEKVAAEQVSELEQLEKAAAIEAFTDAMIENGLDPQQFSDEQIEAGFNQFYNDMSKTAAEAPTNPEQGEQMIKQAWAEADAVGRQIAQAEFIEMVKAAATEYELKQLGLKSGPKAGEPSKGAQKYLETARKAKQEVSAAPFSKTRAFGGKGAPTAMRAKHFVTGKVPAEAGKLLKSVKKNPAAAAAIIGGGLAAHGAGAYGAYRGGKYLKEKQEKAASLQTPFLDEAIEKCAMAILFASGAMTPDGEVNMTKEGEYLQEPSWVEEYELQMPKTALDQAVFNGALAHLEELGYPVNWEALQTEE